MTLPLKSWRQCFLSVQIRVKSKVDNSYLKDCLNLFLPVYVIFQIKMLQDITRKNHFKKSPEMIRDNFYWPFIYNFSNVSVILFGRGKDEIRLRTVDPCPLDHELLIYAPSTMNCWSMLPGPWTVDPCSLDHELLIHAPWTMNCWSMLPGPWTVDSCSLDHELLIHAPWTMNCWSMLPGPWTVDPCSLDHELLIHAPWTMNCWFMPPNHELLIHVPKPWTVDPCSLDH